MPGAGTRALRERRQASFPTPGPHYGIVMGKEEDGTSALPARKVRLYGLPSSWPRHNAEEDVNRAK